MYPAAVLVLDVALFYKRACGWVSVAAEDQAVGARQDPVMIRRQLPRSHLEDEVR